MQPKTQLLRLKFMMLCQVPFFPQKFKIWRLAPFSSCSLLFDLAPGAIDLKQNDAFVA
jgi:hypothetical protein